MTCMENLCFVLYIAFRNIPSTTLLWRHNGRDSVSNHQPHDCLLNRLFRPRSKKTSKLRVTGLCAGNSPGTGEFPTQMASNAENVSIWWRHKIHAFVWIGIDRFCLYLSRLFHQSGRSPKVVALFSATNFSSYIIELLQLHDTIQIKCNYAWIHNNIAIRSHLMI